LSIAAKLVLYPVNNVSAFVDIIMLYYWIYNTISARVCNTNLICLLYNTSVMIGLLRKSFFVEG
jgi:hypothetical protein